MGGLSQRKIEMGKAWAIKPAHGLLLLVSMVIIAGCSGPRFRAPIESRSVPKNVANVPLPPVPEGFYRVRRGDTLIGISLDHGAAWRDVVAWNQIENPNVIEVDQLLRVKPPAGFRAAAPASKPDTPRPESPKADSAKSVAAKSDSAKADAAKKETPKPEAAKAEASSVADNSKSNAIEVRPIDVRPIDSSTNAKAAPADRTAVASAPTSIGESSPPASSTSPKPSAESLSLSWPSKGSVVTQFADPGYKGIAISGSEGDAVLAAGDGRVVYSGNGLRGYGNLVIVKHEGDFLTAYAHNKSIMVNEGQSVRRGQKIAEMGKTDSDAPKLHFEVRKSGKPVDPMKYLPQR